MLKNYIKIAWRNLVKEKGYSAINIIGLSIAIAFIAMVALYLNQELNYDKFHSKAHQLYRINRLSFEPDGSMGNRDPYLPAPLGPALLSDYPQIKDYTRFQRTTFQIKSGESLFEESGLYTDPSLLRMFDFTLLFGNQSQVLAGANEVVISERLAEKLIPPGQDPLGFPIEINVNGRYQHFTISGVVKTIPTNSTIQFDVLVPLESILQAMGPQGENWGASFLQTYVQVEDATKLAYLRDEMPAFRRKYYPDEIRMRMERRLWQDSTHTPTTYQIQNLAGVHTAEGFEDSVEPKRYYQLAGIALIVLSLACFNFTLLSIGKAKRRSLEIGVRKTLGAVRKQIVSQFWSESILTCLISLILALVLIYLTIPLFNDTVQTHLAFQDLVSPLSLFILLAVSLITGILAGFYPALVLSSYNPVHTIKLKVDNKRSSLFSQSLITIQFAISCFFIVSALVIAGQMDYIKTKDLGISPDGIVRISLRGTNPQLSESFKERLKSHSFVKDLSAIRSPFPIYSNWGWKFNGEQHQAYLLEVDRDFIDMFNLTVLEGSGFPTSDTANVMLINESLARSMKGEELLDKPIPGLENSPQVVGIVRDFNFQSLEHEIYPMVVIINPMQRGRMRPRSNILVKMDMENTTDKLAVLEKEWNSAFPDIPFTYTLMSDDLHTEYVVHERWSKVMHAASFMAVLIACLGLVGFSTLYVNNRQKEIGVRKIMGSSSMSIFYKFTLRFMKLVTIGAVLAMPVAWYMGNQWLSGFAFRIEMGWEFFAQGLVVAIVLALAVVGYHLFTIDRLNPVRVLRDE